MKGKSHDMKRLFLVSGMPGAGKTYLAKKIASEHSFKYVELDTEYVQFIKSECPMLFLMRWTCISAHTTNTF